MVHPLIGIHAVLGELGIFSFLWVFVELLNPTEERIKRAKLAALLGLLFLLVSWLAGGYYYVAHYGPDVKPIIKEGPTPWAHGIMMETKEHVFLFLPFLAFMGFALLQKYQNGLIKHQKARKYVLAISVLIILLGLAMAAMGYLISTSARLALEVKVI